MLNPILILVGLTVAISAYAWSKEELLDAWILHPYVMARDQSQLYRFVTSGFLHADWAHLLFNMFAFYSFSTPVLQALSLKFGAGAAIGWFLLLYLGAIIVSSIPTYFRHRDDQRYRSLGASGGVSAIVFASVLLFPVSLNGGIYILPIPFPIQPFLFGVLYLAYSHYMGRRQGDNINHDAHFYGALFGFGLTLVLIPGSLPEFFNKISVYLQSVI